MRSHDLLYCHAIPKSVVCRRLVRSRALGGGVAARCLRSPRPRQPLISELQYSYRKQYSRKHTAPTSECPAAHHPMVHGPWPMQGKAGTATAAWHWHLALGSGMRSPAQEPFSGFEAFTTQRLAGIFPSFSRPRRLDAPPADTPSRS